MAPRYVEDTLTNKLKEEDVEKISKKGWGGVIPDEHILHEWNLKSQARLPRVGERVRRDLPHRASLGQIVVFVAAGPGY